MIKYALDIQVDRFPFQIEFNDPVAFLGSCFTEHIGGRMDNYHFQTFINPSGIVFNPISLAEPVRRLGRKIPYTQEDLLFDSGLWVSLYHHGKYSDENPEACLQQINQQHDEFEVFIKQAKFLIVTFGTAWVYELTERDAIVANCHKIQQGRFSKRLLSVGEVVLCWREMTARLKELNPGLKIVFTVSPVRHLRDGVHENNLNKATLMLAVNQLLADGIFYFPAYELVVDDLRDYRFFESDGAHPNKIAIDYVFSKFRQSMLSDESIEAMNALDQYYKLKNHRPNQASETNTNQLKMKLEELKVQLKLNYPRLASMDF